MQVAEKVYHYRETKEEKERKGKKSKKGGLATEVKESRE